MQGRGGFILSIGVMLSLAVAAPVSAQNVCRRMPLVEESSGNPVIGPEDVAYHAVSDTLFISAHDRAGVHDGGLYALSGAAVKKGSATARVWRVDGGRVSIPHGLSLNDAGNRLAVIDHRDARRASRVLVFPVEVDGALGEPSVIDDPRLTRGNDIAPDGGDGWLVSIDLGATTQLGRLWEVIVGQAKALVIQLGEQRPVIQKLAFANGILRLPMDRLVVAETRAKRLAVFGQDRRLLRRVPVEGAPDNIALLPDGRIAVALLHGGLRLMMSRLAWAEIEPPGSRVIAVDLSGARPPVTIFDDPDGDILKAATSAIVVGNHLVVGSVADSALAVCPLSEMSNR